LHSVHAPRVTRNVVGKNRDPVSLARAKGVGQPYRPGAGLREATVNPSSSGHQHYNGNQTPQVRRRKWDRLICQAESTLMDSRSRSMLLSRLCASVRPILTKQCSDSAWPEEARSRDNVLPGTDIDQIGIKHGREGI